MDDSQIHAKAGEGDPNPPPAVSGGASDESGAAGATVDINTATAAGLETLPGVGPTTAQSIVEYREANGLFGSVEEIQEVPGIGPATSRGSRI